MVWLKKTCVIVTFRNYISGDVFANKGAETCHKIRTRRGAVGIDAEKDAIYAHVK